MSSPAQAPTSDGTGSPVNAPPTSPSAPPATSLPPVQSAPVGSPPLQAPPVVQAPPVQAPVLGSPPVQSPPVQAPPLVTPVASPPPTVVSSPPPAPALAPPTPVIQLSPPPAQNFASPPPPVSTTPPPADTTPPPSDQSAPAPPPPEGVPPPETTPSARRSPPPAGNSSPAPAGAPPLVASGRAPPGSPPAPLSFFPPASSSGSSPPLDPKSLLPPPTSTASSSSISSSAVIGLAAGGVAIFALVAVCLYCLLRRKSRREDYRSSPQFYANQKPGAFYDVERRGQYDSGFHSTASSGTGQPLYHSVTPSTANSVHGSSNSNFSYEELAQATSGFSRANLLGEGGFGCVYKGVLPGGQEVAVKQLKIGGGQGEREFRAEVEIITRIHHRHLVTLVGYCVDANHRLLVYEFVPNDTLDYHLHGKGKQGKAAFDWSMRMKTAIGSSRGLAYLHEDCHPKIIHRDIKSSNILLDNNFEAQVADFGLAKLASDTHTHVSTRVMGTFGYLAPEYASSGKLTDKSDVYSFGVVLLELITGRKPVDTSQPLGEESLVEWSRPLITQALETGNFEDLVDPLLPEYNTEEMLLMIRTAAACVRHSASKRPKMSQIVRILESDADSKGGFNDFTSTQHDTALHSADLRMFRKMALGTSQEYGSEYSGATSEYGANPSVSSREFDSKERPRTTTTDESEWPLRH